jgi:aerobic-type carbon monoxide dehydrogenase small subunit (CoxS/CutS family)
MAETGDTTLSINGERHAFAVDGATTLLDVLRGPALLTGAKRACGQGVCGACNVLMDGEVARACLTLAALAEGHEITTVEGLARDGALSPLQKAFLDAGAVQCGFCMPGMVISATALVNDNPTAGVEEIREAISGNLCRCSGYVKVIDAVRRVTGA